MKTPVRLFGTLFIVSLFFLAVFPTSISEENSEDPWWNDDWSHRHKIIVPIDTSDKDAVYQPIDIFFEFENICWAKDEKRHSVRVIYQQGGRFKELESQIYNLKYSDDDYIESCGLVFLIPEEANDLERYYVYYNDRETSVASYPDRVSVQDSYFSYEPVRGIRTEIWTYNIMQGENIIYSVAKKGTINGPAVCQQVVKMKEDARNLLPDSGEHTISYGFYYWYNDGRTKGERTAEKLVKSEIIIDGNLMVRVGIISESDSGRLRSTVFHKYYYSPGSDKGLYSNVKHEVVGILPETEEAWVSFLSSINGVLKSSIFKELNYGSMPRYMHFYSDEERVKVHQINPYPESFWEEIVGKADEYNLGSIPWVSFDDGEKGLAHGIILDSTEVVSSTENEESGVGIQLYQSNMPNYPGFDGRSCFLYLCRSSDSSIPDNYVVEFKSLYHSAINGGYPGIEKQANLYQSLIDFQPVYDEEIEGEEEKQYYNLTVYTHVPFSLLMKRLGSFFLLRNSYFHVELLYNDNIIGFTQSAKMPLTDEYRVDWGNVSFFRKAVFNNLLPGEYIVKVYLVNPVFGDEREFIGFSVIDLKEDSSIRIKCKSQGKIDLLFTDQDSQGLNDVEIRVLKDNVVIHRVFSNSNGEISLGLPTDFCETCVLNSFYKGFLIDSQQISLNFFNNIIPSRKTVDVEVYDFRVELDYSSGEAPDFNVDVSLTSNKMQESIILTPDRFEDSVYYFENLVPAKYNLSIKYDSTKVTESISIPQASSLAVTLYDLTVDLKDLWGFSFESREISVSVKSFDFDEPLTVYAEKTSEGNYRFSYLYPGDYSFFVNYRSFVLQQNISIPVKDNMIEFIFPVNFNIITNVFDSHGNPLSNVEVNLIRNGKETRGIAENGAVIFSVPPGEYLLKVFYNDELVAQRTVDVLNSRELNIVTIKEPWQPYAVIILALISLIGVGLYSYKHKKGLFFLKVLSIVFVFIALVVPWWSISGVLNDSSSETVTNVYIIPNKMVTITTNSDSITGNIVIMEEMFTFAIDLIFYLSIIAVILLTLNILLKCFTNLKKTSFLMLVISLILITGCIGAFYIATSMLSETTVGSIFGSGILDILIYGENTFEQIPCNWGFSIGFYIIMAVSIMIFLICVKSLKVNRIA